VSETVIQPWRVVPLGTAWAGSSVNCKPYACEGLLQGGTGLFGAFYTDAGELAVYFVGDSTATPEVVRHATGRLPIDAHDTPSLQLDPQGRLHVFCGAHVSLPTYLRSAPGAVLQTLRDCTLDLPPDMAELTYPSLLRCGISKDLFLLYRSGRPDGSDWFARRWISEGKGEWSPEAIKIISGRVSGFWSAGPYLNQPIAFENGSVGLVYVWRSSAVGAGKRDPWNIGVDFLQAQDRFSRLRTGAGVPLSRPVTPANSERILAVPWGADLANQCGACVLDDGRPAFVSCWRAAGGRRQIHFCWQDQAGAWQWRAVTNFLRDSHMRGGGTLPSPFSRPVVVRGMGHRAIVLYRDSVNGGRLVAKPMSGPDFGLSDHPSVVLIPGGLGQYEPVAERLSSHRSSLLHLFIQRSQGSSHYAKRENPRRKRVRPVRRCEGIRESMNSPLTHAPA
jgi:hypothetical protein